jgi:hypothetical protein
MASILVYRNIVVDGMVELNENGSKEEKISSIIKDIGWCGKKAYVYIL